MSNCRMLLIGEKIINNKRIVAYKNGHWFVFNFRNQNELAIQFASFIDNQDLDFDLTDVYNLTLQFYKKGSIWNGKK